MKVVSLMLLFSMTLWSANRAMVNLSDLDTEAEVTMDFYNLFEEFGEERFFISAGGLIINDQGGPSMAYSRIFIESEVQGLEHMILSMGIRPTHYTSDSHTFTTIPIYLQLDYTLEDSPEDSPLMVTGAVFLGSELLTSGDAISYKEFRAGVTVKSEDGMLFLQHRTLTPKYASGKKTLNEGFYAGVSISY